MRNHKKQCQICGRHDQLNEYHIQIHPTNDDEFKVVNRDIVLCFEHLACLVRLMDLAMMPYLTAVPSVMLRKAQLVQQQKDLLI